MVEFYQVFFQTLERLCAERSPWPGEILKGNGGHRTIFSAHARAVEVRVYSGKEFKSEEGQYFGVMISVGQGSAPSFSERVRVNVDNSRPQIREIMQVNPSPWRKVGNRWWLQFNLPRGRTSADWENNAQEAYELLERVRLLWFNLLAPVVDDAAHA